MGNYPMVDQVNLLIGNLLAEGQEIYFPGIGTLYTERRPAQKLSSKTVRPPYREVKFVAQEKADSLVAYIAKSAKCDEKTAQEIYDRWITVVFADESLPIRGVGRLKDKKFMVEDAFEKRLNPMGRTPQRIHRKFKMDWVMWCGVLAVVFAVVGTGYYFWQQKTAEPKPVYAVHIHQKKMVDEPKVTATEEDTTQTALKPIELPAVEEKPQANVDEPQPLTSKRNYVVLGVFGEKGNAQRNLDMCHTEHPDWMCGVYQFGDKLLVSVFENDSFEMCRDFISTNKESLPEMWIYTAR